MQIYFFMTEWKSTKSISSETKKKRGKIIQRKTNIPKTYKTSQRIQKKICTWHSGKSTRIIALIV